MIQTHFSSEPQYLCSTCRLNLQDEKHFKIHFKSEFHVYNLKRGLVNLEPINLQRFNQMIDQLQLTEDSYSIINFSCKSCNKQFSNENTYKQHLESKKHQQLNNVVQEKIPKLHNNQSTIDDISICLFCNEKSQDLEKNLVHMRLHHTFYIPKLEECKNIKGLVSYLAEKINTGKMCIFCPIINQKQFKSKEAVQAHMISKGHCLMELESMEYSQFYSNDNENEISQSEDFDIIDQSFHDDQSDFCYNGLNMALRPNIKILPFKYLETGEIQLHNGKILGHRDYLIYYKQQIRRYFETNKISSQSQNLALLNDEQSQIYHQKQRINIHERTQLKIQMKNNNQKFFVYQSELK